MGQTWHEFRVSAPRTWGQPSRGSENTRGRMASAGNKAARPAASKSRDLAAARRVLDHARNALSALADALNGDFSRAVEAILGVRDRVIVSGMGKSGHIARKIAATLASTGTPAHFIHPAEA